MKNDIKKLTHSKVVHSLVHKSKVIYSHTAQKPIEQSALIIRKVGHSMDIARSKRISHFAPESATVPTKPVTQSTNLNNQSPTPIANAPNRTLNQDAVNHAFSQLAVKQNEKRGSHRRKFKIINIIVLSIIAIAVGIYVIYLILPSISVRIASAQAGINATYPEYRPDGFSLKGPVSYKDGKVSINFDASDGGSKFILNQSKSSWDSTAVKDQVDKDSESEFITTEDKGLTIYTYDGNAAWVNGGILYTITGDAPLSTDQILHIATSL